MSDHPDTPMDESLLSAYLDGELDDNDRARVEYHLGIDPELRAVLDEVAQTRATVRDLPSPELAPSDLERIIVNVSDIAILEDGSDAPDAGDERTEPAPVIDLVARRRARRNWARAGAGVAVAAMVAIAFMLPTEPDVAPQIVQASEAHHAEAGASDPLGSIATMTVGLGLE